MLPTLNEKTIHQRWINVLLTEVYKYLNVLSPEYMNEDLHSRQIYCNLYNLNVFATDNPPNKFMLNSTVYRANQLCQILPFEGKDCPSLQIYKF